MERTVKKTINVLCSWMKACACWFKSWEEGRTELNRGCGGYQGRGTVVVGGNGSLGGGRGRSQGTEEASTECGRWGNFFRVNSAWGRTPGSGNSTWECLEAGENVLLGEGGRWFQTASRWTVDPEGSCVSQRHGKTGFWVQPRGPTWPNPESLKQVNFSEPYFHPLETGALYNHGHCRK